MKRKSASLLTKTQRQRVREGFEELAEAKRRRDQQRVRDRLQSGVADFRLLDDYPDEQLEIAFDDADEAELVEALAATYLTVERVREIEGIERERVIRAARDRAETAVTGDETRGPNDGATGESETAEEDRPTDESETAEDAVPDDLDSLASIDLQTRAEVWDAAAESASERAEPSRWLRWANTSMLIAAAALWITVALWTSDRLFGTALWEGSQGVHTVILFLSMGLGIAGWTVLVSVGVVRDRAVPLFASLVERPRRHLRRFLARWVPPALRPVVPADLDDVDRNQRRRR